MASQGAAERGRPGLWKPRRAPLRAWSLEFGVWRLEFEFDAWSLEFGAWSLVSRLEFGPNAHDIDAIVHLPLSH